MIIPEHDPRASKKIHRPRNDHFRAVVFSISVSKTFSCLTGPNKFCDVRYGVQQCLMLKTAVQKTRSCKVSFDVDNLSPCNMLSQILHVRSRQIVAAAKVTKTSKISFIVFTSMGAIFHLYRP